MPIAQTSSGVLRYVKETTWGTTPASALKTLRITGESLANVADFVTSAEIVSDRQTADVVRTRAGSSGDIEAEVSFSALDDLLEGALMSTWAVNTPTTGTDRLQNGTTFTSFTFEKAFTDLSPVQYQSFKGMVVNSMGLTIQPGQVIKARMSVMGKKGVFATTTVGTGGPTAAPTNPVMNAVDNVTSMSEGGGAVTNITEISFDLTNNARPQPVIANIDPLGIGLGSIGITGSMTAYFDSTTLANKFISNTQSSLSFTLTQASNVYIVTLPAIKYTAAPVPLPGINQDVTVRLSFTAFKDSVTGKSIRIDRQP